jgi:two-component system phosphate regulon sensor histidine kinase PhoR
VKDLFKLRVFPLLLVIHLLTGIVLIIGINGRIERDFRREISDLMAVQLSSVAGLVDRIPEDQRDALLSDPDHIRDLLSTRQIESGSASFRLGYYRTGDLGSGSSYLESLPEISKAFETGSGFAVRRSDEGSLVYGAAMTFPEEYPGLLIHAIITQNRELRMKAFASLLVAVTVSTSFALTVLSAMFLLRRVQGDLGQIAEGIEQYSRGQLNYRVNVRETGLILQISRGMASMAEGHRERIEALTKQRYELESILSNMQEGIILIDRRERVLMINRTASDMFGLDIAPDKLLDASLMDYIRSSELNAAIEELIKTSASVKKRIQIYNHQQDSFRMLDLNGLFIDPAHLDEARILLVLHDISDLMRLEQIRRDFVSNVSHELKTPITTIQGFAETLSSGALEEPEVAREFLNIIQKQSNRMESIVSDLLMLSRLEQQGNQVPMNDCDLPSLVKDVIEVCQGGADAKHINLHVQFSGPSKARANANLIEQALINLMENAIKYGKEGGNVWVSFENDARELVILVRDDGPGIPRRDLPRLFERFYRVDKGRSSSMGGTGLGLAIVKHIAGAHGGSVQADSAVGEGSSFILRIPQDHDN